MNMTPRKPVATADQRSAINPLNSVWVGASAGTGKTKVLTDRMLRLMLPEGLRKGTAPHRILCITYTKAAASEVTIRLMKILREWAVIDAAELHERLEALLNAAPDAQQLRAARSLFADVVDTPGGMKIMTIHGFCQSTLMRFPLEANLPASFDIMETVDAKAMLQYAQQKLLGDVLTGKGDARFIDAFHFLAARLAGKTLQDIADEAAANRGQIAALVHEAGGLEKMVQGLYAMLDTDAGQTPDDHAALFVRYLPPAGDVIALVGAVSRVSDKARQSVIEKMQGPENGAMTFFDEYKALLQTKDGKPRALLKAHATDSMRDLLLRECSRIAQSEDSILRSGNARITEAMLRFSASLTREYETMKSARNLLDFDDLIAHAKKLLSDGRAAWVLFKLDGGIDHLLVDEAQDTNPDQWDIIRMLVAEFHAGIGVSDDNIRTLFVVGDDKQSIFSFQKANPAMFEKMRLHFETRARQAGYGWDNVSLRLSFRSSPSVLKLVDAVFAPPSMRAGVIQQSTDDVQHEAHRSGAAGRAEIWPLTKRDDGDERDITPWAPAQTYMQGSDVQADLAANIAREIAGWLARGDMLESRGRPIRPGDIMILVRKRGTLVEKILQALKRHGVPVAGLDRLVLGEHIAVRDILALMQFACLPDDDLNLAVVLKTPFIGLTDDDLLELRRDKSQSLWQALAKSQRHSAVHGWLEKLVHEGASLSPSGFIARSLQGPCPAHAGDGLKAMTARLGMDAIEPLRELHNLADAYGNTRRLGIQGFLHHMAGGKVELKRQPAEGGDVVQIMTVHGSKGLQAPIVFMPDTLRSQQDRNKASRILWPDRTGLPVPLWAPSSEQACQLYRDTREILKQRDDEEYRRLLYVALTRAEDRLVICGADARKPKKDDTGDDRAASTPSWGPSWYDAVKDGFALLNPETDETSGIAFIRNGQTGPIERDKDKPIAFTADPLPSFATTPAPLPTDQTRPLMPSRPSVAEPGLLSPLAGRQTHRFARGILIHSLMQHLPRLEAQTREGAARAWLARPAHGIDAAEQDDIANTVLKVLADPRHGFLFGPHSQAEVPVTGRAGNRLVSGQIDRLAVADGKVHIVDFKTNRPAAASLKTVPPAYVAQMAAYRELIAAIYPDHDVRCLLLWTEIPEIMDITGLILGESAPY